LTIPAGTARSTSGYRTSRGALALQRRQAVALGVLVLEVEHQRLHRAAGQGLARGSRPRSSPPWPTSAATGDHLRPGLLGDPADGDGGVESSGVGEDDALSHRVSPCCAWAQGLGCCEGRGSRAAEGLAAGGVAGDDHHGVVAGDGADDVGQAGPVQGGGEELRGTRRGPLAQPGWPRRSAETSSSPASRDSRPAASPSAGASRGVGSPPSAGTA
jgi:hypothetical protein